MFLTKFLILACLFLLHSLVGYGQTDSLMIQAVNNPVLKEYNLRKMTVDENGKLWFASDKGIVCYDGNDIQVFDNQTGLTGNSTGKLFFDNAGNILVIITPLPDLNLLNSKTGKFTKLNIRLREEDKPKYAFPYIYSEPYFDNEESIWIGMYNIGFIHYNRQTNETIYYSVHDSLGFKANNVNSIKADFVNPNILWLATDDGIYQFNKETKQLSRNFRCSNPGDSSSNYLNIITMDVAGSDSIWFTIPVEGVGCYQPKTGLYTIYHQRNFATAEKIANDIIFLQRKGDEEYYISSGDKLPGIFNTQTHEYSFPFKKAPALPALQLRHFKVDSIGNFWNLIYYQLYVARHPKREITTITIDPGKINLLENTFKTIVWDQKRKCYYAAFDTRNKLFVFDSMMKLVKTIPVQIYIDLLPEEEPRIHYIGMDKNSRLWVCGTELGVLDEKTGKVVIAKKLFPALSFGGQQFQNLVFRDNYMYLQPSNPTYKAIYRVDINRFTYDSIPFPPEIVNDTTPMYDSYKITDVLEIDKNAKNAYFCYRMCIFQLNLENRKVRKVYTIPGKSRPVYGHEAFNPFWYKLDDNDNLWVTNNNRIMIYDPQNLKAIKKIDQSNAYEIQKYNIQGKGIMCLLWSEGLKLYDYKNNYREYNLSLNDGLTTIANYGVASLNDKIFVGAIDYLHYISLADALPKNLRRKCYLSHIQLFNKTLITDSIPGCLSTLRLPHNKNFISLTFSTTEYFQQDRIEYRYKLKGVDKSWVYVNYLNRTVTYNDLKPGSYFFYAMVKNLDGRWSDAGVKLHIIIVPAWWQTDWFKIGVIILFVTIMIGMIRWRIKAVRKQERKKSSHQKELLELEAKALRAQMNPHFIFNCMNSIKSLMQEGNIDTGVAYLTTFSKLIRTLFNNADKKEISLYDEIETCKLYLQLEAMRFDAKFSYSVNVDETIDLKSINIPALIIQPFIENAIWHGIIPKESGGNVSLAVCRSNGNIEIGVEDDGIGREASRQNKAAANIGHQSKGVNLTQSRLELDNLLQQRQAKLETIDKKDENGKVTGTKVTIILPQED